MSEQRSLAWVQAASTEEIHEALATGQLDALLQGEDVEDAEPASEGAEMPAGGVADLGARGKQEYSITDRAQLVGKGPDEISRLLREGRLDFLLRVPGDGG